MAVFAVVDNIDTGFNLLGNNRLHFFGENFLKVSFGQFAFAAGEVSCLQTLGAGERANVSSLNTVGVLSHGISFFGWM